jgi:hypothetical protein
MFSLHTTESGFAHLVHVFQPDIDEGRAQLPPVLRAHELTPRGHLPPPHHLPEAGRQPLQQLGGAGGRQLLLHSST